MKILHLVAGNLFGGVETILVTHARNRSLCPELVAHFGVCFEARLSQELKETGVPVHILGAASLSRPWTVAAARRRLDALLRAENFDAVVCHMSWVHAIFGATIKKRGCALIAYLHNRATGDSWPERWARQSRPDCVIAVSRDTAQTAALVFPGAPVEVCYSPLPAEKFAQGVNNRDALRQEMDTPLDCTLIIQVSRMESWKGHRGLLTTLAELGNAENWFCWIVGGAQRPSEIAYLRELQSQCAALGLGNRVRFLGERRDVPQLMAAADLFFQPNEGAEGFSIVFMEALLAGLPVVTSSIGGAPEIIDETCGFLLPPADIQGFAQALRQLVRDSQFRRTMGNAGRQRAFTLCDTARQLEAFMEICRRYK